MRGCCFSSSEVEKESDYLVFTHPSEALNYLAEGISLGLQREDAKNLPDWVMELLVGTKEGIEAVAGSL